MKKREKIERKGFTLVEMIVSVSIISLISLSILSYSKSQESLGSLNRYSQKLSNDLKEARNNALNMKDLIDVTFRKFIYCGWGIHFDISNNEYFLFKDKCISSSQGNRIYDSSDEKMSTFKISQGIILETGINDLVFEPPQPNICINGNCNSPLREIYLKASNLKVRITINPIGLISFEYVQ